MDKKICDTSDTYYECYNNCSGDCEFLMTWLKGGIFFLFFDFLTIVMVGSCAFILLLDLLKVRGLRDYFNTKTSVYLMIAAFFLHLIGFIVWAALVKLKFTEQDNGWPNNSTEIVEADDSSYFAIFTIGWLFFAALIYIFLAPKVFKDEVYEEI